MAKSVNFRVFQDGGDEVRFAPVRFREVVDNTLMERKKTTGKKVAKDTLFEEIAEKVAVSKDAVKNWYQGKNGVSDWNMIRNLAQTVGVDYKELIVPVQQESPKIESNFTPEGKQEKDLIVQMYQLFVDYLYWFGGGDRTNADFAFDDPMCEKKEYVQNLYHFLDSIAFYISDESFYCYCLDNPNASVNSPERLNMVDVEYNLLTSCGGFSFKLGISFEKIATVAL